MPEPVFANVIPDSAPVEFLDALPGAQLDQQQLQSTIAENVAKEINGDAESAEKWMKEIVLPSVNWLKVNPSFLDGSTAISNWRVNPDGKLPGNVAKLQVQMNLLIDWGYEFTNTIGLTGQGNYIMMFFRLKEDAPKTVKVHYSQLTKYQQIEFNRERGIE